MNEMNKEDLSIENWKYIAEELWKLLHDIDIASRIFNPKSDSFYEYTMENVAKRNEFMKLDGYNLIPIKYSKVNKQNGKEKL